MQNAGASKDLQHYEDYLLAWKSIMAQKTPIVCYKDGSDEIIGLNFTFVTHKDDHFVEQFQNGVSISLRQLFAQTFSSMFDKFMTL